MGDGRIYFIADPTRAKKCKYINTDKTSCDTGNGCGWDGHYFPEKQTAKANETQKEEPKQETAGITKDYTRGEFTYGSESDQGESTNKSATVAVKEVEKNSIQTATDQTSETEISMPLQSKTPPKKTAGPSIDDAKKEAKLAAQKVEEMKMTMAEIKMNNENNAILYRSPDADLFSVDSKFKAFESKLSGSLGGRLADSSTDTWNKKKKDGSRGLASVGKKKAGDSGSGEIDASSADAKGRSSSEPANSATSDNPWVNYMGQTTKAALIDRLRKNPSLLDSLRDRIAELQSNGDKSGVIELMEEALAEAEKEGQPPLLDNLKPMSITEAFSMDAAETEAHIRSLLADLDTPSDPQFLPQTSLFERVNVAHRRSILRGSLKRQ